MRPIDADALIEKYGNWYVEEGTESGFIGTLKELFATGPTIHPVATDINDGDLISRKMVLALRRNKVRSLHTYEVIEETINVTDIEQLPSVQTEIILCKDCKHRPIMRNGHIVPPEGDEKCPCLCDDYFYSWRPKDNFFCANGKRREDEEV